MGRSYNNQGSIASNVGAEFVDSLLCTLTGNTNNFDPAGGRTVTRFKLSSSGAVDLTGLAGGSDNRFIVLQNVGAGTVTLKASSGSSSAANRFVFQADVALAQYESIELYYTSQAAGWTMVQDVNPAGAGTVTSVDGAGGNGVTVTGGPITGSGTLTVAATGRLMGFQILTGSGTYTPTTGANKAIVIAIGGGGGSGGVDGTIAVTTPGDGAGAGAVCQKLVTLSGTYAYACGAAGAAGASGNNPGTAGGTTTFTGTGAALSAPGGNPSTGAIASANHTPGNVTAAPTGGDLNTPGDAGAGSSGLDFSSGGNFIAGAGASVPLYGAGGAFRTTAGTGSVGVGFGAGAGGALSTDATNFAGAAGTAGAILVWEFS